ncbi:MAG: DUF1501 domain-containing protein [Planctomycetaceae bacterium]|nr:DUF1501 domain-containing protein [Planctomycetaceae bacterium]
MNRLNTSRRNFLSLTGNSLTGTALASLLLRDRVLDAGVVPPSAEGSPHHSARAKRVVHLCLCGGFSHIDSFDYKPDLAAFHGKSLQSEERPATFFNQIGLIRRNDWEFRQRGDSGLWISDMLPHLAEVADELTVIRSMVADSANHTPATFEENSGFRLNGFPVMGSWISYGLGCETDELPSYVVLPDARGWPAGGAINWSNAFLPAQHQGVAFRSEGDAIPDLFPARDQGAEHEAASRRLLSELNRSHLELAGEEDSFLARMRSYELAAKMQLAVPEVSDLNQETQATRRMYGLDQEPTADFGSRCLLTRRLLEKGVRFVQLFSGGSFGSPRINWDGHEDVYENHTREASRLDQPVAALIRDLRQRGMLEDTLILCTTEFGRTPFTQSGADTIGKGRDHNMYGFTIWMAGAGLRKGIAYGSTDDIGWKAVDRPVHWYDYHATVLHLLGIDHERLTYYHNGIRRRLTNVHGEVLQEILT